MIAKEAREISNRTKEGILLGYTQKLRYTLRMEPVSTLIAAILSSPKVKAAIQSLAKDALGASKKAAVRWLQPTEQEKAAKQAIGLFTEEWSIELEDKCPFNSALGGYQDQLRVLVDTSATEIVEWMDPETTSVDLRRVETTWSELGLDTLPNGFDWKLVAQNYARSIRNYIRKDPNLRAAYDTALRERTAEATERVAAAAERLAGPTIGFDLSAYRKFLIEKKCNALQLATLHFSTYTLDRRVSLWSVFVPQSARESAPVLGIPPETLRRLRDEGHLAQIEDDGQMGVDELLRRYRSSPLRPILEILDPEQNQKRHIIVIGDPGAGKSALLKYRALQWANEGTGAVPLIIDLKEYAKRREGLLKFCQTGLTLPKFDATELERSLKAGQAALYLDGLDEIFDPAVRHSVIEEIATMSAEYPQAPIVVTSRKVGYQPERLGSAGFFHATLEDFDQSQIGDFIERWHQIAEDNEEERDRLQERLTRAVTDSASIRELAGNPLLLTMMAILSRSQELPRNRVALYSKASEVLLHDWDADRALHSTDTFDRGDKEVLLRDLAGEMQQAEGGLAGNLIERSRLVTRFSKSLDQLGIPDSHKNAIALVKQLEERNFILASAGAGRFSYVHRTFLEYFCADWFVKRLQNTREITLDQLKEEVFGQHWKDEKWHEVLRLIVGMVSEQDAAVLIQFLMEQDGGQYKLANLMLAAGCLYEVRNRKAVHATSELLWKRFVEEAVRYKRESYEGHVERTDERFVTRGAAVHWIALAWRGEQAHTWLRASTENDPDEIIRCAAIQEIARGWKDDPQTLPWLMARAIACNDLEGWVAEKIVQELARGFRDDPRTYSWLMDHARNDGLDWIRRVAIEELALGWSHVPEVKRLVLDRARDDDDWFVRSGAIWSLMRQWPGDTEAYFVLKQSGKDDENGQIRRNAIVALATSWPEYPETLRLLKDRALNDKEEMVREVAIEQLATQWPDDPDVIPLLQNQPKQS